MDFKGEKLMRHIIKYAMLAFCLNLAFIPVFPLLAQEKQDLKQVPQSATEIKLSFAPIVKKTAAAVVNVYGARRDVRGRATLYDDPLFREFFGGGPSGGRERVQQSVGSGVIVSAEGIIITNHHVIEGMTEVKVALADKREIEAEIVLRDPRTDLAVLKIKSSEKLTPIELSDSDTLEIGDVVLAIGNPFGVGQTVTQGIVSALARTQVGISDYQFFIQTDAAINPGNSGGALVDMQGKLVGINTAIFSRSGGNQGIGFAIPANMVKVIVQSAKGGSVSVKRPWFGARLQSVTSEIAEGLGLARPVGALVASVVDGSPAMEAGLKRSDVITAIDSVDIDDPDAFGYRFSTKGISGQTSLSVLRGGKKLILPVSLKLAPEIPARELVKLKGDNATPFAGATIVNLSPAISEELSLSTDQKGVVINDIESGSVAEQLGFQKADIILAINGVTVTSTAEVSSLLKRGRMPFWRISINRGGQIINTVFGG
jgi:Do/DeqQ family serine protease